MKLLEILPGGHGAKDTNRYLIPMCVLSLDQLEILTGVTGRQLVLPITRDEGRSEVMVGEILQPVAVGRFPELENHWLRELESQRETLKGLMVRQEGSQDETQTRTEPGNQPGLGLILKEKGKTWSKSYVTGKVEDRIAFERGHEVDHLAILKENAPEVWEFLQKGMKTVDAGMRTGEGLGTRMRRELGFDQPAPYSE